MDGSDVDDDPDDSSESSVVTEIVVDPAEATIDSDATQAFSAEVLDQNGESMDGETVTWLSSDEAVATINGDGLATAAGEGTTTISAAIGSVSGSATLSVNAAATSASWQAVGNLGATYASALGSYEGELVANAQKGEDSILRWDGDDWSSTNDEIGTGGPALSLFTMVSLSRGEILQRQASLPLAESPGGTGRSGDLWARAWLAQALTCKR